MSDFASVVAVEIVGGTVVITVSKAREGIDPIGREGKLAVTRLLVAGMTVVKPPNSTAYLGVGGIRGHGASESRNALG
ncbi:MAG: hypothetical protein ACI9DF_004446 [Verrucomicrobiales bacterium]|jgi:hypothetical protein